MVTVHRSFARSSVQHIGRQQLGWLLAVALWVAQSSAWATDYQVPWTVDRQVDSRSIPAWLAVDGGGSKILAAVVTLLPGRTKPEVIASFQTSAPRGLRALTQTIYEVSIEAVTKAQRAERRLALQRALSVALPGDYRHGGFTVRTGENLAAFPGEWNGIDLRILLAERFGGLAPDQAFVMGDGPASAVGCIDRLRDPETGLLIPGSALMALKPGSGLGRGLVWVTESGQLRVGRIHEGLTSLPTNGFRFAGPIADVDVSLDVLPDASGFRLRFAREGADVHEERVPGRWERLWSNLISGNDLAQMLVHLEHGLMAVGHPPALSKMAEHTNLGVDTRLLNDVVLVDSASPTLAQDLAHWIGNLAGLAEAQLSKGLHRGELRHDAWPEADQRALRRPGLQVVLTGAYAHSKAPLGAIMGQRARRELRGTLRFHQDDHFRRHLVALGAFHAGAWYRGQGHRGRRRASP